MVVIFVNVTAKNHAHDQKPILYGEQRAINE